MRKMMLIGLVLAMAFAFSVPAVYAQQQNPTPQTSGWYCPRMGYGAAQSGWYCPMVAQGPTGKGGWYRHMRGQRGTARGGWTCPMMNYNTAPPAVQN